MACRMPYIPCMIESSSSSPASQSSLFRDPAERRLAEALAGLASVCPFLPARVELEQQALGDRFVAGAPVWSVGEDDDNPNVQRIASVAAESVERWRRRLQRRSAPDDEVQLYRQVAFLVLYEGVSAEVVDACAVDPTGRLEVYAAFLEDHRRLLVEPGVAQDAPEHLFACIYQVRRAFLEVYGGLSGASAPAVALRAAAWRSIFSVDPQRYRRFLYRTLPAVPTLVRGPTGTGKELVARAIGRSGYIPFDPHRQRFVAAPTLRSVNLSALPATLVESELFGHVKGAFTGAVRDRVGWLAELPPGGAVFLDEVGDLDPVVQVKLLRVLEERRFVPVGQTEPQPLSGKIIAATHVDLEQAIERGHFRRDLFYRLCGDPVRVPSLRDRLDDAPAELAQITRALLTRDLGPDATDALVGQVVDQIVRDRGDDWPWTGNVRELAQCVRGVLVHGHCRASGPSAPSDGLATLAAAGATLADVQQAYVRVVYAREGSYRSAGERLGIDWRTVRSHVSS